MAFVVPAVLPSSRKELERWLKFFSHIPSVKRVQIDVVDGRLATPASWPYSAKATQGTPYNTKDELRAIILPKADELEYEIDLMCIDALSAAGDWLALGASRLTFHIETVVSTPHFFETVRAQYGGKPLLSVGLALNVGTDKRVAEPYLKDIDYVQFMGIAKIGMQGQAFAPSVLAQIRAFRAEHPNIPVQVDGGVNIAHARELNALGVANVIVGSAILEAKLPSEAITAFQAIGTSFGV